jgi:hypothetical protein
MAIRVPVPFAPEYRNYPGNRPAGPLTNAVSRRDIKWLATNSRGEVKRELSAEKRE